MQRFKHILSPAGAKSMKQVGRFAPESLWWVMLFGLVMFTVACGAGRSASDKIVMRTQLPALTRTPLPTLTPTPAAAASEIVLAGENGGASAAAVLPSPVTQPGAQPAPDGSVAASAPLPEVIPVSVEQAANPAAGGDSAPAPDFNADPANNPVPAGAVVRPQNVAAPTSTPAAGPGLAAVSGPKLISAISNTAPVVAGAVHPFVTPTPRPTKIPLPTRMATPAPAINLEPTATPDFKTSGWSFASTRINDRSDDGLLLYGEVINDTGSTQELYYISGTFYNDEGQIIAGHNNTADFVPIYNISPGERVPFELIVNNIGSAAKFDLWARSESGGDAPRRDNFEFLDVTEQSEDDTYCLSGLLANRGDDLDDYVDIVAILYDDDDNVIKFNESYQTEVEDLSGDETLAFEICVDSLDDEVARYDLRAWGQ